MKKKPVDTRYFVTDSGELIGPSGRVLKPRPDKYGNAELTIKVRLKDAVARAFLRPILPNEKIVFRDGDRTNCDVGNLLIVARQGTGSDISPEERDARNTEMRKMRSEKATLQSIADKFGVSRERVRQIVGPK